MVAGRDPARWVPITELLGFNKMKVLMRGLETKELTDALQRHQKNFKNCSFELTEDSLKAKKLGLVVPAPRKQPAAVAPVVLVE